MKNFFKNVMTLFIPLCFYNCSDDNTTNNAKSDEAKYRIEVVNSGNSISNFNENTTIQIFSNNNADVTGVNWNEIDQPSSNAKWFSYEADVKDKIVYETSEKVVSITYSSVINKKISSDDDLNTTVKIFADDKLIKTESFNTNKEITTISIPVVSAQL